MTGAEFPTTPQDTSEDIAPDADTELLTPSQEAEVTTSAHIIRGLGLGEAIIAKGGLFSKNIEPVDANTEAVTAADAPVISEGSSDVVPTPAPPATPETEVSATPSAAPESHSPTHVEATQATQEVIAPTDANETSDDTLEPPVASDDEVAETTPEPIKDNSENKIVPSKADTLPTVQDEPDPVELVTFVVPPAKPPVLPMPPAPSGEITIGLAERQEQIAAELAEQDRLKAAEEASKLTKKKRAPKKTRKSSKKAATKSVKTPTPQPKAPTIKPKPEQKVDTPTIVEIVPPAASAETTPTILESLSTDIELTAEEVEKVRWAEQARYLQSIDDARDKKLSLELEPEKLDPIVDEWSTQHPRSESANTTDTEYVLYVISLEEAELENFTALKIEEQDELIKEYTESRPEPQPRPTDIKPDEGPVIREILSTTVEPEVYTNFLDNLSDAEYLLFKRLSQEVRDRMILLWKAKDKLDYFRSVERFLRDLTEEQTHNFHELDGSEQLRVLSTWMDGGIPNGFEFKRERYNGEDGLQAPSYRIFDLYEYDDKSEYEIITEHKLRTNALSKEEIRELTSWKDRMYARIMGRWYNLKVLLFNYEAQLAEENKHNQEMIRGIVDTGPDENERLVFAQKHGDVYLDYNGNVVSKEVVEKAQKKALHHPARFQALCHYELSKREEPEQQKLWSEIFEMMAHHHYDRYAMFGVVIGLQFMNKPSYLAYKNAIIEWMPEVEFEEEHGHPKKDKDGKLIPVLDDDGNPKLKRYTAESIYEVTPLGRKVVKKDGDGMPVKVGDVVRSKNRAHFVTMDYTLNENDQEYHEKDANGEDKYKFKTKIVRDDDGNVLYEEKYKTKKILKVKRVSFAHELGGKFMSYQYGFRSADVMVMYDEARHAMQTALKMARLGKFKSREMQEALYLLSRIKFVVDTSRLGGGTSADGKEAPGNDETRIQRAQEDAIRRDAIVKSVLRDNPDLTPAEARSLADAKLAAQPGGGYPPRLSGTAEANVIFLEVAKLADYGAEVFPCIMRIRNSDYEAIQDEIYIGKH